MNIDYKDNSPEMRESRLSAQSAVRDDVEGQVEDVEQATANAGSGGAGRRRVYDWRADLEASRNLSVKEKSGFGFVIGWMEEWRMKNELPPGLETARDFWRGQVKVKERAAWQLEGWTEGIRWYLNWQKTGTHACGAGCSGGAELDRQVGR